MRILAVIYFLVHRLPSQKGGCRCVHIRSPFITFPTTDTTTIHVNILCLSTATVAKKEQKIVLYIGVLNYLCYIILVVDFL